MRGTENTPKAGDETGNMKNINIMDDSNGRTGSRNRETVAGNFGFGQNNDLTITNGPLSIENIYESRTKIHNKLHDCTTKHLRNFKINYARINRRVDCG